MSRKRRVPPPPPKPRLPSDRQLKEVEIAYVAKYRFAPMRAAGIESPEAVERYIKAELRSWERKDVLTKWYPPSDHVIICEGDSWFNHPILFDLPEYLLHFGYSVLHSNYPGKLLKESLEQEKFLAPLEDGRKPQIKALLLSGGGNDLINWRKGNAEFSPIFQKVGPGHPAADYIDPAKIDEALGEMMACLAGISDKLAGANAAKLPVILHCYDYITPKKYGPSPIKGTWINPQLDAIGAENDAAFRKKITGLLQARWIEAYEKTCAKLGWHFLETQNIVKGRWHDEIHPNNNGFYDIASLYWYALHEMGILPSRKVTLFAAAA
jgi:hypothetical protein